MKPIALAITLMLFSISCKTPGATPTADQRIYVQVQCRNENSLRSQILQLLRAPNARDLTTNSDGDFLDIEVVYVNITPREMDRIDRVEQQLKQLAGVVLVDIRKPVREVRQEF